MLDQGFEQTTVLGDQNSNGHRHYYSPYCLHGFTKERLLAEHMPYCQTYGPQNIELPTEEDKWLHCKDTRKQLKVPYVIYADFESLQVPILGPENFDTYKDYQIHTLRMCIYGRRLDKHNFKGACGLSRFR